MTNDDRQELDELRDLIGTRLGLDFDESKVNFLDGLFRHRQRALRCDSLYSYRRLLMDSPAARAEIRRLAEELTVGETYFLRNSDQFAALTQMVLPEFFRAGKRNLKILSAGCSSGEEAYSLALALNDLPSGIEFSNVRILGIDINPIAIQKARRAHYSAWSLRGVSEEIIQRHFHQEGKEYVLNTERAGMVSFEERNLCEEDPSFWATSAFDVIFCRNVVMYFSVESAKKVIARFANALRPNGYLFLGHAENLRGLSGDFRLCHELNTFYYQQKGDGVALAPEAFRPLPFASPPELLPPPTDNSWIDAIANASENITKLANGTANKFSRSAGKSGIRPEWNLERAFACMRDERFEDALQALNDLPAESRKNTDAELLRAVILTNRGRVAEAEAVCADVLGRDALNAGAHYIAALCHEHSGNAATAQELDAIAIYLDPHFAMPRLHAGLLAKKRGDHEAAKRELGRAIDLLATEDAARILLFGGGFSREGLSQLCRSELRSLGIIHD